jgi:hypothetical protein
MGIVGRVGEIGGQRVACPQAFERVHPQDPGEKPLWRGLLATPLSLQAPTVKAIYHLVESKAKVFRVNAPCQSANIHSLMILATSSVMS